MRPPLLRLCVTLASGAAGACGSGSELTCEVLADPTNCWASAAAAAKACVPAGEIGVLAPDRASCAFTSGQQVVFETPLPQTLDGLERLAFTIEANGATCASFVDTFANRMELEAGGHRVVSELHAGGAFHLHCQGGASFESDFDRLFECAGQGIPPPTDGFDVEPTFFSFSISSVTTPGELFRCETP